MITAAILQENGYIVSTNSIPQELITRCENDILAAYIMPILPDYIYPATTLEEEDLDIVNAVYCLTYMLLLARTVVKTRYGSRQKDVASSRPVPTSSEEIEQLSITADMYLTKLKAKEAAAVDPVIYDICKIYNLSTLL